MKNIFVTRVKTGFKAMNKVSSKTENPVSNDRRSKRLIFAFLISGLIFMAATLPKTPDSAVFTVVLDAGHGGDDPGNLGTGRKKRTEKIFRTENIFCDGNTKDDVDLLPREVTGSSTVTNKGFG